MTSLWRELTSASWVANTGIPLLLTIAAILAGFWAVRRQMHSDRMLLIAQSRAEAARMFGTAVLQELDKVNTAYGNDSPVWHSPVLPVREDLRQALSVAGHTLGGLPGWMDQQWTQATVAIDMIDHVWRYAVRRREAAAMKFGFDDVAMSAAMSLFLFPFMQHLKEIAQSMLRWDGVGPLPSEPLWDAEMPVGPEVFTTSRHKPKGFWTAEHSNAYRAGEPRDLDPEWYAELDMSWQSCLECWHDIIGAPDARVDRVS